MASSSTLFFFFLSSLLLLISSSVRSQPLTPGLSFDFYRSTCPQFESIVRTELRKIFRRDIGVAAGLLHLHLNDCFSQGCDGSVLLTGSESDPSKQDASLKGALRPSAFKTVYDIHTLLVRRCGRVVSCADTLTVAARDSIFLSGGPDYALPLGRRDGLPSATQSATKGSLLSSSFNASQILAALATKNFTDIEAVALSGAHTIGVSHCSAFTGRLYPTQDPSMDQTFANNLRQTCPTADSTNTTVLDIRSPNVFDNRYYVNLMNRQGLFTSDQDLYNFPKTRGIVTSFAVNQSLFYEKFVEAMVKMSQLQVLTGNQGEIRAHCSAVRNPPSSWLSTFAKEWSAF